MCAHCYKLASEKVRLRILKILKKGPQRVTNLVNRLEVTQPTVTHHLKLLEAAGLVRMEKRGVEHFYSLATDSECFTECGLLLGL